MLRTSWQETKRAGRPGSAALGLAGVAAMPCTYLPSTGTGSFGIRHLGVRHNDIRWPWGSGAQSG